MSPRSLIRLAAEHNVLFVGWLGNYFTPDAHMRFRDNHPLSRSYGQEWSLEKPCIREFLTTLNRRRHSQ